MSKNFLSGHRKWNTLAFRGRLMSLLVLMHSGSHLGLISPRSLAYSICLDRLSLSFTASFFTSSQFHKRFNLFIIRSTASLIGTESVRLQWKSTVLAHIERIQIYVQIYILRQKGF